MGYYSDLFTQKCENTKATDAYVMIVEELLSEHPDLIGQYEPYFTEDMSRAEKYTGVTRYTKIEEKNIAIKTGFSTSDKKKNLERIEKGIGSEHKAERTATEINVQIPKEKNIATPPDIYEIANGVAIYGCQPNAQDVHELKVYSRYNVIEYRGYIYYIDSNEIKKYGVTINLCRYKLGVGTIEVMDSFRYVQEWGNSCIDLMAYGGCLLSISRGRVFYTTGREIRWINLENGKRYCFKPQIDVDRRIVCCIAFRDRVIFHDQFCTAYKVFDINSGQVYTLTKISRKITSFTDTEIVFDNEVIFNVITGESEKLSKRFPGIRGKNVVFVSLERDIVYYLDKNEPLSEHSMIIGINSSGEKVDLWKWPELPDHFGKGGYDSLCFDGRRISVKMSKNDTTIYADICMFERSGKCTARYPLDLGRIEGFGASHYMTENGILFLARNVDRSVYASTWLYDELLGDCLKIGDYC